MRVWRERERAMACQGAKASELFGKTATATTREYGPLSRRRSSRKKKDILKIDWDLEKKSGKITNDIQSNP